MCGFWQCEFDYLGVCDGMMPDAEVVCVAAEVFEALRVEVAIRINRCVVAEGFGAGDYFGGG
jgi:histidyl-tRNA synthetase